MRVTYIVSLALLLAPGLALAQGGYGSLSYLDWEVEQTDFPRLSSAGFRATGGYMVNEHLGIEGHIGSGGTDDIAFPTGETTTEDAEAELNKLLSVFARGSLPVVEDRLNVFGLFGYSYSRIDILAETTTSNQSESGFSWGAGVEVAIVPERLYLSLDHIAYISQRDIDANATSLGLRLNFGGQ